MSPGILFDGSSCNSSGETLARAEFPCALIPMGFPGDSVVNNLTTMKSLGQEGLLDEEMATHSSILAWRIPWTEDLGGWQSTGFKESHTTFITPIALPSQGVCGSAAHRLMTSAWCLLIPTNSQIIFLTSPPSISSLMGRQRLVAGQGAGDGSCPSGGLPLLEVLGGESGEGGILWGYF